MQYEALERENRDLHRFLTEALAEVERLKEVERGLKRDKATLLSRVEELEAAQHSADQQQEAEEAARQAEAEEAARRATEVNRLVEEAALRHWQESEATLQLQAAAASSEDEDCSEPRSRPGLRASVEGRRREHRGSLTNSVRGIGMCPTISLVQLSIILQH